MRVRQLDSRHDRARIDCDSVFSLVGLTFTTFTSQKQFCGVNETRFEKATEQCLSIYRSAYRTRDSTAEMLRSVKRSVKVYCSKYT